MGNIRGLKSRRDVKIRAEPGIPFQPVFVVGLQPVNPAVLISQEGNSPVDLVVIFQAVHLIIFIQAGLQILCELIVRLIPDSQNIHPVLFQFPAEQPVICRKIW